MKKTWQVQEAKARLSEVIKEAKAHGPQQITHHGELVAVIISKSEYEKLKGYKKSLVEFAQDSPLKGLELDISRGTSLSRDIEVINPWA